MLQCPTQKSVVVMRKSDGAFITGDAVRQLLKIPKGGKGAARQRVAVDTDGMPDFSLFVQSTSHNRVLMPNTKVLYRLAANEVEETLGDEGRVAGVVGRRCANKGGGGVRQMRSASKKPLTKGTSKATKAGKTELKNAAKKRKISVPTSQSAPPGGQGCARFSDANAYLLRRF